jgi:hypothetical protein
VISGLLSAPGLARGAESPRLAIGGAPSKSQARADPPGGSSRELKLTLGTQGFLYPANSSRPGVLPSLELSGRGLYQDATWDIGGRALAITFLSKASAYTVEAPEAYLGTSRQLSPLQFHVGRRLESWSRLDEAWSLGIWQPRFLWDTLDPEPVGLTGAFATYESGLLRVVAYGSPLYVPERGVPVDVENGEFVTEDPYFDRPAASAEVMGEDTRLRYQLARPSTSDVISHGGGALRVRVGEKPGSAGTAWSSVALARKPMNQLLFAYAGLVPASDPGATGVIYPRVSYHDLLAADLGYQWEGASAWVAGLVDVPQEETVEEGLTAQKVSRSTAVSAGLDLTLPSLLWVPAPRKTSLQLSYLHQAGGNEPDVGSLADGKSSFTSRYPYQQALLGRVSGTLLERAGSRLLGSARLLWDLGHAGTLFTGDLDYRINRAWSLSAGADILTAFAPEAADGSATDFIARYRAQDRVRAGVSYAF